MPVLRRAHLAHGGPRDPALERRWLGVGQHRRLLRPLQPPQGRPAAPSGQHASAREAAHAGRAHLHPAGVADHPGALAAVPPAARSRLTGAAAVGSGLAWYLGRRLAALLATVVLAPAFAFLVMNGLRDRIPGSLRCSRSCGTGCGRPTCTWTSGSPR